MWTEAGQESVREGWVQWCDVVDVAASWLVAVRAVGPLLLPRMICSGLCSVSVFHTLVKPSVNQLLQRLTDEAAATVIEVDNKHNSTLLQCTSLKTAAAEQD